MVGIAHIRTIEPRDNEAVASIVKQVMTEFNADPKTTVLGDPSINKMYENYQEEKAIYYIAELDEKIIGGCGIKKLDGGDGTVCELQRMFLLPESRRKGIGKELMEKCIKQAREFGYEKIYLESLKTMEAARKLYEKYNFKHIAGPMGSTGHSGCDVWMVLNLLSS